MRALVLSALLLLPVPALADANGDNAAQYDASRLTITFGAFCQRPSVGEVPAPDTAAKKIDLIDGTPEIRWPGHVIPAAPGISFGVRTMTHDAESLWPVMIELTHPAFAESGTSHQTYYTTLGGSDASINAYSFDLPEELVTGTWTLTAVYAGDVLYSVNFEVVPAEALPEIANGCIGYLGS